MEETYSNEMASKGTGAERDATSGHGEVLSPEAFARQYKESMPLLWCIAAAVLGRSAGAEDVLQEAAMIALSKLGEFRAQTSFNAWLGQIIRYVALNHRRKEHRQQQWIQAGRVDAAPSEEGTGTAGSAVNGVLRTGGGAFDENVMAALNTLDDVARTCLLLRTVMELPYRQIALVLGIPEGTAMSHVHRSRTQMRSLLVKTVEHGQET